MDIIGNFFYFTWNYLQNSYNCTFIVCKNCIHSLGILLINNNCFQLVFYFSSIYGYICLNIYF